MEFPTVNFTENVEEMGEMKTKGTLIAFGSATFGGLFVDVVASALVARENRL
jgi:hypothetical protein